MERRMNVEILQTLIQIAYLAIALARYQEGRED